jgi:hypothetical protein
LATVAKRRRLRTRFEALQHVAEAQALFRANLEDLRSETGLPMRVAASHGDFVNRRIGAANWLILEDPGFRGDVGVDLEGYDHDLLAAMPVRSTDTAPPRCWTPTDPSAALRSGEQVVYALVHPRHWRVARSINARDNLSRVIQEVDYRSPGIRRGR